VAVRTSVAVSSAAKEITVRRMVIDIADMAPRVTLLSSERAAR